jgi:hypothetical protein
MKILTLFDVVLRIDIMVRNGIASIFLFRGELILLCISIKRLTSDTERDSERLKCIELRLRDSVLICGITVEEEEGEGEKLEL